MDDVCAQKKPPERLCPRGAKDTLLFRERLDAPRPRRPVAGQAAPRRAYLVSPKRATCFLAGGRTLRGPQAFRRRGLPRCGPIHVDCLSGPYVIAAVRLGAHPVE